MKKHVKISSSKFFSLTHHPFPHFLTHILTKHFKWKCYPCIILTNHFQWECCQCSKIYCRNTSELVSPKSRVFLWASVFSFLGVFYLWTNKIKVFVGIPNHKKACRNANINCIWIKYCYFFLFLQPLQLKFPKDIPCACAFEFSFFWTQSLNVSFDGSDHEVHTKKRWQSQRKKQTKRKKK